MPDAMPITQANHPNIVWGQWRQVLLGGPPFDTVTESRPSIGMVGFMDMLQLRRRDPGRRDQGEAVGCPDPEDVQAHGLWGSSKKSYIIPNREG